MANLQKWIKHGATTIFRFDEGPAYFFATNHVAIDADGAPDSYHPSDTGRDALANAGYPNHNWRNVLVEDPQHPGQAFVQKTGAFKGYFVSMTSLRSPYGDNTLCSTYVDAAHFPYLVLPGGTFQPTPGTGSAGDLVMAFHLKSGKECAAVIGDFSGADDELGEISVALAEGLGGINVDARTGHGAIQGLAIYAVFPGTHANPRWPVDRAAIQAEAQSCLQAIGGWTAIRNALSL